MACTRHLYFRAILRFADATRSSQIETRRDYQKCRANAPTSQRLRLCSCPPPASAGLKTIALRFKCTAEPNARNVFVDSKSEKNPVQKMWAPRVRCQRRCFQPSRPDSVRVVVDCAVMRHQCIDSFAERRRVLQLRKANAWEVRILYQPSEI